MASTVLEKYLHFARGQNQVMYKAHLRRWCKLLFCQPFGFHWRKVHTSVPFKSKILLIYLLKGDGGKSLRKSSSDLIQKNPTWMDLMYMKVNLLFHTDSCCEWLLLLTFEQPSLHLLVVNIYIVSGIWCEKKSSLLCNLGTESHTFKC